MIKVKIEGDVESLNDLAVALSRIIDTVHYVRITEKPLNQEFKHIHIDGKWDLSLALEPVDDE